MTNYEVLQHVQKTWDKHRQELFRMRVGNVLRYKPGDYARAALAIIKAYPLGDLIPRAKDQS